MSFPTNHAPSRAQYIVSSLVLAFTVAACDGTAVDPDEDGADDHALAAATITPNRLLRNREVIGVGGVTVGDVQALLAHYGSALASYREAGKSAARWIHDAAVANNLSPIYLLARIETESGLIRSGTLTNLSAATGCRCPDSAGCDPSFAGFGVQVRCAAEKFRGYLRSLNSGGSTISGWRVGVGRSTLDPCWVIPANKVTAALYTYTPWVGAYAAGCGTSRWGGSSLVAVLTRRFQSAHDSLGGCPLGDGVYCGDSGIGGDAHTLYRCTGGDLEELSVCENGCEHMPPGTPDRCRPATRTIVVDNDHRRNNPARARVSISGQWNTSHSASGYVGSGYAWASVRAVSDPAAFEFYLSRAETRTIDARWTAGTNRSSQAPFIVEDAAGNRLDVIKANQRRRGGQWNQLGTYAFRKGWNRVRLSRWAADGDVVIADAIRVR